MPPARATPAGVLSRLGVLREILAGRKCLIPPIRDSTVIGEDWFKVETYGRARAWGWSSKKEYVRWGSCLGVGLVGQGGVAAHSSACQSLIFDDGSPWRFTLKVPGGSREPA